MAILEQEIGGGSFTISSHVFTTLQDSISHFGRHFLSGSYDCVVGLIAFMGSITDSVVSHNDLEHSMVLGARTQLSPRQINLIASFSTAYPEILAGPKSTQSAVADFSALRTYAEWDYGDGHHVLSITLTKSMQDEVEALKVIWGLGSHIILPQRTFAL